MFDNQSDSFAQILLKKCIFVSTPEISEPWGDKSKRHKGATRFQGIAMSSDAGRHRLCGHRRHDEERPDVRGEGCFTVCTPFETSNEINGPKTPVYTLSP